MRGCLNREISYMRMPLYFISEVKLFIFNFLKYKHKFNFHIIRDKYWDTLNLFFRKIIYKLSFIFNTSL